MKKELSIIIINYRKPKLTIDCLKAVFSSQAAVSFEVLVLDNNSQDNSAKIIKKKYPQVKYLQAEKNLGFAGGNNLAAKKAQGKYLLFLNNDTLIYPDTIEKALARIKRDRQIGVLGSKILNKDKTLQRSVYRFPSLRLFFAELFFLPNLKLFNDYRYFKHDREKKVDFVIGAFLLMPAALFKKLGGFDERFFMYAEESDLCLRVKKQGKDILFYPDAKIIHLGGGSADKLLNIKSVFLESKNLYIKKNIFWPRLAFFILFLSNFIRSIFCFFLKTKRSIYLKLASFYGQSIFK